MDKRIKNIVGQKFGRLTVIKYLYSKKHKPYWLCQCDCGNEYVACSGALRDGNTRSCGCLAKESFREMIKNNIAPVVTICHFDTPIGIIEKFGGWKNRKFVEFYLNYCKVIFERYKDKVKYWMTFNEINMILHLPFMGAGVRFEEGDNELQIKYQSAHHELIASALATKMALV